jgi:hypothetical protein
MENILLINNKTFFERNNIVTIDNIYDIPNESCILFIGSHEKSTEDINKKLEMYFERIDHYSQNRYVIIVGKTDQAFEKTMIPPNVVKIFMNNILEDEVLHFLPMGRDFRSIDSFHNSAIMNNNRSILCYCNYSLDTYPLRKVIFNEIRTKKFIRFENMGTFLNYTISRDVFFQRLNNSKFVICPRGNGLDTFRFYDSIYSGAIPIVVKCQFHHYFQDVPILFLENEGEYKNLTEDYLNEMYEKLKYKKSDYYQSMDFNYWIDMAKYHLENAPVRKRSYSFYYGKILAFIICVVLCLFYIFKRK